MIFLVPIFFFLDESQVQVIVFRVPFFIVLEGHEIVQSWHGGSGIRGAGQTQRKDTASFILLLPSPPSFLGSCYGETLPSLRTGSPISPRLTSFPMPNRHAWDIHPTAFVSARATLYGVGTIGERAIVQESAILDSAEIGAWARIHRGTLIDTGARIAPGVAVGPDLTLIGEGAIVAFRTHLPLEDRSLRAFKGEVPPGGFLGQNGEGAERVQVGRSRFLLAVDGDLEFVWMEESGDVWSRDANALFQKIEEAHTWAVSDAGGDPEIRDAYDREMDEAHAATRFLQDKEQMRVARDKTLRALGLSVPSGVAP